MVELNKLLQLVVDKNASDIHLTVGIPPTVRMHGNLRPLNLPALQSDDTVAFMKAITPERIQQELKEKGLRWTIISRPSGASFSKWKCLPTSTKSTKQAFTSC